MKNEIYWLSWSVILTAVMVVPYAAYRVKKIGGLIQIFLNPLPGDDPFDDEWAHRAYRAHMNAFEGLILFAPMALAVSLTGHSTENTILASAIYFWSRLVYTPLYYINAPFFRTAVWFVGFLATLYLAFQLVW